MLNPYAFLNIYKSGYKLSAKNVTYASKAAYEIQMKAQNKRQQFSEVLVTLSAANAMPLCVRFRQASGKWVRIQVGSISLDINGLNRISLSTPKNILELKWSI